jgi:hypothetical protein
MKDIAFAWAGLAHSPGQEPTAGSRSIRGLEQGEGCRRNAFHQRALRPHACQHRSEVAAVIQIAAI